ncbi:MAG: RNA-binding protein [Candidatus Margulisbacteria bacterium]|nr:RNA-binding protein [Candidatus Margulisiibacteriota bacterium]MBU1022505.1 RNA-binding protein [Candidatus Margulisiibacteriota bacterium]MBU1728489.1 RNA-binding protein [Candidatus Margulisiibacteriota bacterium]MBU1954636.1 RNA-binding protein [Candidatus Margulisiibacteriota bacterium]
MKSLFVGNLSWSVTDETLKAKFAEFGNVISARIIKDKFSGKSRGFGFVDMEDADAEKAIAGMNGVNWDGRDVSVNEAKPRADRRESRG